MRLDDEGMADQSVPIGRDQFAEQLSRLTMGLGRGVSVRRFETIYDSLLGSGFIGSTAELLVASWKVAFPQGTTSLLDFEQVTHANLPCLFIDPSNDSLVWLVRGISAGRVKLADSSGQEIEVDATDLVAPLLWLSLPRQESMSANSARHWFESAIRSHSKVSRDAMLSSLLGATLGVVSALYTMQVYDRVVPTSGFDTLKVLTVGVLIAVALEFLARQIKTSLIDRISESVDLDLGQRFFERGIDLNLTRRPKSVGTMASQIKNFESVRSFLMTWMVFKWADLPFALVFLAVIWLIGGYIVLVPLVLVPLGIIFGLLMRRPIEAATKINMAESNKKSGLLADALDGVEYIKAVGCQEWFATKWRGLSLLVAEGDFKVKRLSSLAANVSQSIQQLSYIGMVALGAYLVSSGDLTMGSLIACTILSGRALAPFAQIPNLIVQGKKSKIALEALDNMVSMPFDRDSSRQLIVPDRCVGEITTSSLSFGFEPDRILVELPALVYPAGQKVAVIGSVGSGKSMALRILAGLHIPNGGSVRLDGYDLRTLAEDYLREQIFYLPQDIRLFEGSLRDNLTMGLPLMRESEIMEACEQTKLSVLIASHPRGLDLEIAEGGQGLSVGQRQLVALTRLLLAKPKVAFLDEPTSAMDSALDRHIIELLFGKVLERTTVILVTHKMGDLKYVDRVTVMNAGRMVLDGPRDDVIARLTSDADGGNNDL